MKLAMSLTRTDFGLYPYDHVSWSEMQVPDDFIFSADLVEISERALMPAFAAMRAHYIENQGGDAMTHVRVMPPTALRQAEALRHLPPRSAPRP